MLKNIPGNVQEDSGGMLAKTLVNAQENGTLYNAIKRTQNQRIHNQI